MNPLNYRCRHYRVQWLTTHSGKCCDCGKVGHWFENEGMVMWVRDDGARRKVHAVPVDVLKPPMNTNAHGLVHAK